MIDDATLSSQIKSESESWLKQLVAEVEQAESLTLGMLNGSRDPIPAATFNAVAKRLSEQLSQTVPTARLLAAQFGRYDAAKLVVKEREDRSCSRIPAAVKSALGNWYDVKIDEVAIDAAAADFQTWLPVWKQSFQLLLLNLGALDSFVGQSVGRLCDSCYLTLGPQPCASREWLLQHIGGHQQTRTPLCGTLVLSEGIHLQAKESVAVPQALRAA